MSAPIQLLPSDCKLQFQGMQCLPASVGTRHTWVPGTHVYQWSTHTEHTTAFLKMIMPHIKVLISTISTKTLFTWAKAAHTYQQEKYFTYCSPGSTNTISK